MGVPNPSAVTEATTQSWKFQQSYIERLMDHSALTSAHPDDTLVLAGPARYIQSPGGTTNQSFFDQLLPLGMIQQANVGQQRPVIPAQAVGSARMFFLTQKTQNTVNIARLLVNGRNLLRALSTNAVRAGIDPSKLDDIGATSKTNKFFANLDSELFLIPFGLAVLFRDKIHDEIGAFYMEVCMINSWNIGWGAGQAMIVENVNMVFDRLRPIDSGTVGDPTVSGYSDFYDSTNPASSKAYKTVFGENVPSDQIDPGLSTK